MRELTTAFSVLHILFLCISGAITLIMSMSPLGEAPYDAVAVASPIWMEVVPNLLALLILLVALWYFARLAKSLRANDLKTTVSAEQAEEKQQETQDLRQRVSYLEEQLESMKTMLLERY